MNWLPAWPLALSGSRQPGARARAACAQVLEAQMLPATAPFYMGIAAGWAVLVGAYVHHTGARVHTPCHTPLLVRRSCCFRPTTCKASGQAREVRMSGVLCLIASAIFSGEHVPSYHQGSPVVGQVPRRSTQAVSTKTVPVCVCCWRFGSQLAVQSKSAAEAIHNGCA